jgi:hypothetical protein
MGRDVRDNCKVLQRIMEKEEGHQLIGEIVAIRIEEGDCLLVDEEFLLLVLRFPNTPNKGQCVHAVDMVKIRQLKKKNFSAD